MPTTLSRVLSVSELTSGIRSFLEQEFPDVWVEGEVSNLRSPSSGHLYFTLKDPSAQIRAVLFRGAAQQVRFALEDGLHILVRGRLTVYEPRGDYQIIVDSLEPKGVGALQIAFEQLKEKLDREGLFAPERKRPLPRIPKAVGVVTSLSGAAIQDMLTIIHRRCPIIRIVIYPVPVQGEGAAMHIADAIDALGRDGKVDVMIVGRGGGSLEDLWCFNEEMVVRAVAQSPIPVISAVGHEIDYTLTDFAADVRAPTPSAAAETVSPVLEELLSGVVQTRERLIRELKGRLRSLSQHLQGLRHAIPDPLLWVYRNGQRLDDVENRLWKAIKTSQSLIHSHVHVVVSALNLQNPQRRTQQAWVLVVQLLTRLKRGMPASVKVKRHLLQTCVASLDSLSPLATLSRGYSILNRYPRGPIIRSIQAVQVGDKVRARVLDGQLLCHVENIGSES